MLLLFNFLLAAFCLLLGGFTMAILYLVGPILFWIGTVALSLNLLLKLWVWRRLSSDERLEHSGPGHLMNSNYTLSTTMEWVLFLIGFGGTIFWFELM